MTKDTKKRHLAFLLSIGLLMCTGCQQEENQAQQAAIQPPQPSPEVGVLTLHPEDVPVKASLPGRTVAYRVAEIRPQVDGLIEERVFSEGSQVEKGDLLYQIDPKTYQAAVDSANASLAKAKAAVPSAQALVKRYKQLLAARGVSQQDMDDAQASLMQAQADVKAAVAEVESAQISLRYTKVTAPIDGRIGNSQVTQGALVTANQDTALATIRQIDPIYVDLTDSSTNMLHFRHLIESGRIRLDNNLKHAVTLRLEDGSDYEQQGYTSSIDPIVSETTDTITVRATMENPQFRLLPGMYVRATIQLGTQPGAFLLPQRAVSRNPLGQATAQFLKSDNTLETRLLTTERVHENCWVVSDNVADGDRLVIEGGQKVLGEQTVKPIEMRVDEDGLAHPIENAQQED